MQEISLNILDVAQNSVSAGAKLIEIKVESDEQWLQVVIRDDGCGMTSEQVERVIDPFYTTRTTRKVGLGVPLFKMAAELSGGSFEIQSEKGKGTVVTAVFDTSNIDCMPLGDLNATIASLIQLNAHIDFVFLRRIDQKSFVLDTREMREALGEVPLDHPEVVVFVREFLKENTEEIIR